VLRAAGASFPASFDEHDDVVQLKRLVRVMSDTVAFAGQASLRASESAARAGDDEYGRSRHAPVK
jgi:hypothetical protein